MARFIDGETISKFEAAGPMTEEVDFEDGSFNGARSDDKYNCRDLCYEGPFGMQSTLEKYGMESEEIEIVINPNEIKKSKNLISNEIETTKKDIDKAVEDIEFLSKKEKKAVKRVLFKRLETIKKEMSDNLDTMATGISSWAEDIETELEDKIDELKDAIASILDITEITTDVWPKTKVNKTYKVDLRKDYSSDIPEVKANKPLKINVDKESLEQFLCQSDGNFENIAMITADNREFDDIEKVIFKIVPVDDSCKKRQPAFTEADGKAIAEMLDKQGLTKCGWIHTHPFSKTSTFFSGTDVTNTKEMCVLPDDYSLAIVVGCKYLDPKSYMKDGTKIMTEQEVEWSLGSMLYQKKNNSKDKVMRLGADMTKDMSMIKYDIEITIVDKEGKPIDYPNLSQDNSIMESIQSFAPCVQQGLYPYQTQYFRDGFWVD